MRDRDYFEQWKDEHDLTELTREQRARFFQSIHGRGSAYATRVAFSDDLLLIAGGNLDHYAGLGYEHEALNFFHDIDGISSRLDRETGKLTRFFVPRCAKHATAQVRTSNEVRRANAQKRAAKGRR